MKKIKLLVSFAAGAISAMGITHFTNKSENLAANNKIDKFKSYYDVLNQWLLLKQQNISLTDFFIQNNYKNVAIYGMGELGNRLYDELEDTQINVSYGIDQSPKVTYKGLSILSLDDSLDGVDAVIVTTVFAYDSVKELLSDKFSCPVIPLSDIVCTL